MIPPFGMIPSALRLIFDGTLDPCNSIAIPTGDVMSQRAHPR
jgi:hypothetical protein